MIKAVDHGTGRTIAWILGGRDAATFQRWYDQVKHRKDGLLYTENWDACAQIVPKGLPGLGKVYTHAIERDNAHTRRHLARLTRKTKVVSTSEEMMHASCKLWCALSIPTIFAKYQTLFLSIFI